MRKIKVLEVIRQGQIGGGESHLLDLIYYMDKERFTTICLSFTGGNMINRLHEMGIECHVIDTQRAFDLKVQRKIISLVRDLHIDIIHAHGSRAASNMLYAARHLRLPFIYTVHGWSFHDDQPKKVYRLRQWSEKLICKCADQVICVSQSNAITGMEGFGLKNPVIIENGVNLDRFNPHHTSPSLRRTFGFSDEDFVAGFIGRCTLQKSPIDFLHAIKIAHSADSRIKGLFVGEGDMDAEVDAFIQDNDMKAYIYRSKFRTDIPDLLRSIDVFCLPSLWEGLSIGLLEAMAMQKAIIATPTDGTKEVLEDEMNGLIIPMQSPNALAKAIVRLYQVPALFQQCASNAGLLVANRFDARKTAQSVADIYKNQKIASI